MARAGLPVVTALTPPLCEGHHRPWRAKVNRPHALFVGDYNCGKSTIINALLRSPLVPTACEETTSVLTFIGPRAEPGVVLSALRGDSRIPLSKESFQAFRHGSVPPGSAEALFVEAGFSPFSQLVLVDSEGISSTANPELPALIAGRETPLVIVLVLDIEYWSARHSLNLLSRLAADHERLVLVANKADQVTAADLRRIRESASRRVQGAAARSLPFFSVSARLEASRGNPADEYRAGTKAAVREACDASFDGFRLALYEFEARYGARQTPPSPGIAFRRAQGASRRV